MLLYDCIFGGLCPKALSCCLHLYSNEPNVLKVVTAKPLLPGLPRYGHLPQPQAAGSLFYADLAETVGSTVGVANYSL